MLGVESTPEVLSSLYGYGVQPGPLNSQHVIDLRNIPKDTPWTRGGISSFGTLAPVNQTPLVESLKVASPKGKGIFAALRLNELKDAVSTTVNKGGQKAGDFMTSGKGTPLLIGLEALSELNDPNDPFGKNIAEGAGAGLGAWGGSALGAKLGSVVPGYGTAIGAILGAILLSETGKDIAGGAYNVINPRGVQDYKLKQIRKAGELKEAQAEVLRGIARGNIDAQLELQNKQNMQEALINAATGGF